MKVQRHQSIALAALSCSALALLSRKGNFAAATTSGDLSTFDCIPAFIGDGDCDYPNNNESCGELKRTTPGKLWRPPVLW